MYLSPVASCVSPLSQSLLLGAHLHCSHLLPLRWLKSRRRGRHSCFLKASRPVLRKFYTTQSAGKTLLREAGFVKPNGEIMPFHVDHIYSLSSKNSAGRGIDHVSNFYLLSEPQNVLFSDNPELQRVKLDCIGEVARRAATQLDSYVTQSINSGVPVADETRGSAQAPQRHRPSRRPTVGRRPRASGRPPSHQQPIHRPTATHVGRSPAKCLPLSLLTSG